MTGIRIGIISRDEKYIREIVTQIKCQSDLELAFHVKNNKQLCETLESTYVHVILIDVGPEAMSLASDVKIRYPNVKIIVLSDCDFEGYSGEIHFRDVRGFISKYDDKEIIKAIKVVNNEGIYIVDHGAERFHIHLVPRSIKQSNLSVNLRERTVLKLIIQGFTSKEIGQVINKSHRTVEDIREKLYEKFKVKNKEQLIAIAVKNDIELS